MRTVLITIALIVLTVAPARAQDRDLQRAKAEFVRAETHYRLGEFQQALELYRSAYKLAGRPHLLFNVAQCYRQLGKVRPGDSRQKALEQAVFYYKLYLSDWKRAFKGASPRNAAEVQRHIKALSETILRIKEQLRLQAEARQRQEQQKEQEQLRRERQQPVPEKLSKPSRWKRPWAWITAGAGRPLAPARRCLPRAGSTSWSGAPRPARIRAARPTGSPTAPRPGPCSSGPARSPWRWPPSSSRARRSRRPRASACPPPVCGSAAASESGSRRVGLRRPGRGMPRPYNEKKQPRLLPHAAASAGGRREVDRPLGHVHGEDAGGAAVVHVAAPPR